MIAFENFIIFCEKGSSLCYKFFQLHYCVRRVKCIVDAKFVVTVLFLIKPLFYSFFWDNSELSCILLFFLIRDLLRAKSSKETF